MALKPTHLVVTTFANSAKIAPPAARGLTRCYASEQLLRSMIFVLSVALAKPCTAASLKSGDLDECGPRTMHDGIVFALWIGRTLSPDDVLFELCQRKEPKHSFVLVTVSSKRGSDKRSQTKIPLDEKTYAMLEKLYESALEYNVKDGTMGVDGSEWCLATQRGGTYSQACFWSPGQETKARDLVGLEKLGEELWQLGKLDETAGELY